MDLENNSANEAVSGAEDSKDASEAAGGVKHYTKTHHSGA